MLHDFVFWWIAVLGIWSGLAILWGRHRDEHERRRRVAARYPLARDTIGDRKPPKP